MANWNWCNLYNCWCADANEITDGDGMCDYNCDNCEDHEEIKP